MADITLEKNHALLEKLTDFVMTKIPQLEAELTKKTDLQRVEDKVNQLINGIDHLTKEVDDFRVDMKATSYTIDNHEERLGTLEQHTLGYRVRDKEEKK
jgi:hypothetical protein